MRRAGTCALFAALAVGAALAALAFPGTMPTTAPEVATQTQTYTLKPGTRAIDVTFGPDGNLWFTWVSYRDASSEGIGRMTVDGEVEEISLGDSGQFSIGGIDSGPEGALWFARSAAGSIGRAFPGGSVDSFPLPDPGAGPVGVAVGGDGTVWFAEAKGDRVGRIGPDGAIVEFPLPSGSEPTGIAVAPDGNLWVTERGAGRIARIAAGGDLTSFQLPGKPWVPSSIVSDAGGNLWFNDESRPRIGRIVPSGEVDAFPVPGEAGTGALAVAPSGQVFYAQRTSIGRISPEGQARLPGCAIPTCDRPVTGMAVGPDGHVWFGTGTRIVEGGGGGGHLLLPGEPGLIGKYVIPTQVVVGPHLTRLQGRYTTVGLWCDGGESERACAGSLTMEALFRFRLGHGLHERRWVTLGERSYGFGPDAGGRVALTVSPRGRRAIRRHGVLEVQVRAEVDGGQGSRRETMLRGRAR
jgi:virginiamycin B lyase